MKPFIFALLCLTLTGCPTGPYPELKTGADAAKAAIQIFEDIDHAHKRDILSAATPTCRMAPDPLPCFKTALAPYQTQRDPAVKAAEDLAPLLMAAENTAKAADGQEPPSNLLGRILELTATLTQEIAVLRGGK